jgi:NAD(P)H-dependent FMN reductase
MTDPVSVAMIVGSARPDRFTPRVAAWFAGQLTAHPDVRAETIDLAASELSLRGPSYQHGPQDAATLADTMPRLAAAEAFVVVTPEYNHGFPAVLKNFVDWHLTEWMAKPVAFVSHGGMSGGLRAVEQLRLVFAELHAVTIRDTVSFHGGHAAFDDDGQPVDGEPCSLAAKTMIAQLLWWARTLRTARKREPYRAS